MKEAGNNRAELRRHFEQLSRFENLFQKENVVLGLMIWLKSTGLMWLIQIGLAAIGLLQLFGQIILIPLVALSFYLIQWAAATEARKRYSMPVLPTCWWSIFWRILLFMLPLWIALTFMMPEGYLENPERMIENPVPLQIAQLTIMILSVIPMGMITSKAYLISFDRISSKLDFSGKGSQDSEGTSQKEESEKKIEDSNGETS
jgi:hypothetical protein